MAHQYNCIIVDDEPHAIHLLISRLAILYKNITVAATYGSWETAFGVLRDEAYDLVFMDISMPGKNGIELLKLLPGLEAEIIFVTAHEQFAIDSFAFSTSGYILKPIDDAMLLIAVNKALDRIRNKQIAKLNGVNNKIGINNKNGIDYVDIKDILYLESTNKCTRIVTLRTEYISSHNIGKFEYLTEDLHFFHVHRSYMINLDNILRYESQGFVIMTNKKEIPVPKNVKYDLLKRIAINNHSNQ